MSELLLLPCGIFTLHSTELVLTITVSILTGYLLKLFIERVWSKPETDETSALETELETLQGKFSAEIIKKDEESKMLQEEIRSAEKKNFDLQLQYAKALNHIEKLKTGSADESDAVEFETAEAGNRILHHLQEKIISQEAHLLQLEQQLQQSEQQRSEQQLLYEKEHAAFADLQQQQLQQKLDQQTQLAMLQEQLQQKEQEATQYVEELHHLRQSEKQLLEEAEKTHQAELAIVNDELAELKQALQQASVTANTTGDLQLHKEGITSVRSSVEQVNDTLEQFRLQVTNMLRDTYSYDQLLAANERLHQSIEQLQLEQEEARQELTALQHLKEEKHIIEELYKKSSVELEQLKAALIIAEEDKKNQMEQLQLRIYEQEQTIEELKRIKDELQNNSIELKRKLDEKDRLSKEMIHAVKDIENRFERMYASNNGEAVLLTDDETQYSQH